MAFLVAPEGIEQIGLTEPIQDAGGPNTIVSSRRPDDLAAFCAAMVEHFAHRPAAARRNERGAPGSFGARVREP